jgi:hypothetical protein
MMNKKLLYIVIFIILLIVSILIIRHMYSSKEQYDSGCESCASYYLENPGLLPKTKTYFNDLSSNIPTISLQQLEKNISRSKSWKKTCTDKGFICGSLEYYNSDVVQPESQPEYQPVSQSTEQPIIQSNPLASSNLDPNSTLTDLQPINSSPISFTIPSDIKNIPPPTEIAIPLIKPVVVEVPIEVEIPVEVPIEVPVDFSVETPLQIPEYYKYY